MRWDIFLFFASAVVTALGEAGLYVGIAGMAASIAHAALRAALKGRNTKMITTVSLIGVSISVALFAVFLTLYVKPNFFGIENTVVQSSFFIDCVPAPQPVKSPSDGRVYSLNLLPHGGGGIFGEQIGSPGDDVRFVGDGGHMWLYRCQVTNYGTAPLISADIPIKIRFMESVPNRQGFTIGKETFSALTIVKIRKIDPGISNSFTFYIYNQTEAFSEVDFQKTATAQKLGETARINVSIATNLDRPLSLGPRDNRPVVESQKISKVEPQKQPAQIVAPTPAEKAASDYLARSTTVYNETIRKHLETICAKVADHFGSRGWAEKNQVTKMIDVNSGDTEPLEFVKAKYADSVWMADRVLVAFETNAARPMFMSYVFIGRIAPGREIVGVFDEMKQWRILADGAPDNPKHYDAMLEAADQERSRLLERLAPEIEKLR